MRSDSIPERGSDAGSEPVSSVEASPEPGAEQDAAAPSADDAPAVDQSAPPVEETLEETRRQRDEYLELAQRSRAELENYRKRVTAEASEALRRGKSDLAKAVLPALDNLGRAVQAAGVDALPGDSTDAPSEEVSAQEALGRGVALVYRELSGNLERAGVTAYDPIGERFNPAEHEAIGTRPEAGHEAGVVVETLDPGYRLDGQVLRPARVVVSE